jgi:ketosteroid isomerase-like protein
VRLGRIAPIALTLAAAGPPLYAAAVRALLRRNIRRTSEGDPGPLFRSYADDICFVFPGTSSWSGEYRGRDEVERWVRRFVDVGLQLDPEEILVNGPPWKTMVCVRYADRYTAPDGELVYENRGTIVGTIRWGKLTSYEVHEDTHKVADFDQYLAAREHAHA